MNTLSMEEMARELELARREKQFMERELRIAEREIELLRNTPRLSTSSQ